MIIYKHGGKSIKRAKNYLYYSSIVRMGFLKISKPHFKWIIPFIKRPKLELRKPKFELPSLTQNRMTVLVLVTIWFLLSGGIYILIEKPTALAFTSTGSPIFLYPQFDRMFLLEGLVAGILFIVGGIGFILIYQSTKYAYDPKYANLLLYAGIALILVSYFGVNYMLESKLNPYAYRTSGGTGQAP